MNKTTKLVRGTMAILIATFVLSMPLLSLKNDDATKKAEAEMTETFGTVPIMFKVLPSYLRAGAWEWFKASLSSESAIPAKYTELIALGVASQIPCDYCVYAHTTQAKLLGATDEEIQQAIASAAETRHWSTVLNGAEVPLEKFKKEWDGILAYITKQSEAKETMEK